MIRLATGLCALAAAACLQATAHAAGVAAASLLPGFSAEERTRLLAHGPWPPRPGRDASNRADGRPAAIAWGRRLFADRRLSADGTLACADCHVPSMAFQEGGPRAQGRGAGLRNTPSLLDAARRRWFGWDGAHDSLWAASLAPLLNPREMVSSPATLAGVVRTQPDLRRGYRAVFGEPPGDDDERVAVDVAKALAAWQATLVSPRTPFDDFRDAVARGDRKAAARYPAAARRGLQLFVGAGRCHLCHAGPDFSNGEFADVAMPYFVPGGVDPGRHGGLQVLRGSRMNRLGPYNDAGDADARAVGTRHLVALHRHYGEFRVPGLRQLVRTAPYMHDGSLETIEDVVRHYSELDEERLHADGERILRRLDLTPDQAADLAAFLRSLSR